MSSTYKDIRPSPIAGTWYSADPHRLRASIERYLHEAQPPELTGEVVALIVPHAGHIYSGPTTAHAFKTVIGSGFERVVVISPSHHYYPQPILTSAHQAYKTPLGILPIDSEAVEAIDTGLRSELGLHLTPIRHDDEHALEIELPFVQCVLPQVSKLIPIMLRDQSARLAQGLGKILADTLRDTKTLLVASTDLSHFYTEDQANRLDQAILAEIGAFNPDGLYRLQASGEGQACGLGAAAAVLWAAQALGADKVTVVDYRTSANVTQDSSSVVGYGAAVVTKST